MNDKLPESDKKQLSSSPRWKGARSLQLAHELNGRCIDLLCDLAANPRGEGLPAMLQANRALWYVLDHDARWRLAKFPFVIIDVRFRDELWWQSQPSLENDTSAEWRISDASLQEWRESLLLETLMFAWQAAREDRRVAQILFAMSQPVARFISSRSMQDIRTLAIERSKYLRVRWDDNAQLWRDFLVAIAAEDDRTLEELRLYAKLLFCGDLISKGADS
jgi:hypothetical protein